MNARLTDGIKDVQKQAEDIKVHVSKLAGTIKSFKKTDEANRLEINQKIDSVDSHAKEQISELE